MNEPSSSKSHYALLFLLQLGTVLCLAGWTWSHFYLGSSYGVLLWQNSLFELAHKLGIDWDAFVGSGANDGLVQLWLGRVFWLYLICLILSITAPFFRFGWKLWFHIAFLILGSGLLTLLAFVIYVESEYELPAFVEHGGQFLMPTLFASALVVGSRHWLTVILACVALTMTFVGHGLYAIGVWPTPPQFIGMTSLLLGMEYENTCRFLRIAGMLDIAVCIGILTPMRRACCVYAIVWGLATAVARPCAGMSFDLNYWGADQYVHEVLCRAPHFFIPLYLFFFWSVKKPNKEQLA